MRHYLVGPHSRPDLVYTYVELVTIIAAYYLTPKNIIVKNNLPLKFHGLTGTPIRAKPRR